MSQPAHLSSGGVHIPIDMDFAPGIDTITADFEKQATKFQTNKTGPFADPVDRALAYRMIIEKLIEFGRPDTAIEKFNEANELGVWTPQARARHVLKDCEKYQQVAKQMIDNLG